MPAQVRCCADDFVPSGDSTQQPSSPLPTHPVPREATVRAHTFVYITTIAYFSFTKGQPPSQFDVDGLGAHSGLHLDQHTGVLYGSPAAEDVLKSPLMLHFTALDTLGRCMAYNDT